MEKETLFARLLEDIKEQAKGQGGSVTKEQVQTQFSSLDLETEQLELVYEFLRANLIGMEQPIRAQSCLTQEETAYLEEYESSLQELAPDSEEDKFLQGCLKHIVAMGKELAGKGVLIEDLIGEGNLLLSLHSKQIDITKAPKDWETKVFTTIREGMQRLIEEAKTIEMADEKVVDWLNTVADKSKEMQDSLQRKPTLSELSHYMSIQEEELREVIQIAGNQAELVAQ